MQEITIIVFSLETHDMNYTRYYQALMGCELSMAIYSIFIMHFEKSYMRTRFAVESMPPLHFCWPKNSAQHAIPCMWVAMATSAKQRQNIRTHTRTLAILLVHLFELLFDFAASRALLAILTVGARRVTIDGPVAPFAPLLLFIGAVRSA